ncbi:MAG: EamA family transporter, partial [Rhizobiales bacterium]|nr:EamA family transporter [Hyphomicrobiales bacterium]
WGFNQVAVKLALPDIPPLIQATIRTAGATLMVGTWAWSRSIGLFTRDGTLIPGIVSGILFGLEFICIYRGLLWTTAVRAVLFIYFAPFFVVLGARWFLPADRFAPSQWLGLALSFAGLILAFGLPTPSAEPYQLTGDMMMVGAAAFWAATTMTMKATALQRAPFVKQLLYQLTVSTPIMGAAAWLFGERIAGTPSGLALGSLVYQTVWVAGITFLGWFWLVQRYSASRLSAFTFLTPLFGVLAGYLVLGEPLTPAFVLAALLVAAGLILVNRPR